jgi:hypothetical protein
MNQKQKDTIRKEYTIKAGTPLALALKDNLEAQKQFLDLAVEIRDQAYQHGAKDKVEEVVKNWKKSNKKKDGTADGMNNMWASFDDYIDTLKDNT